MSDSQEEKSGGVVLLSEAHQEMENPWGQPVVGWRRTSQGGGLFNPRGFAMQRVVNWKLIDGEMVPLYDQPMLVENPGAIVVAMDQHERIALVQQHRNVGPRIRQDEEGYINDYVSKLDENEQWDELFESLGQDCWEVPRGLIDPNYATHDFEQFVTDAAEIEAKEEAGVVIDNVQIRGNINTNPTFFAHAQPVVSGVIVEVGDQQPENLENIGDMHLFSLEEVAEMTREGVLIDGITLAAIAACGIRLPL